MSSSTGLNESDAKQCCGMRWHTAVMLLRHQAGAWMVRPGPDGQRVPGRGVLAQEGPGLFAGEDAVRLARHQGQGHAGVKWSCSHGFYRVRSIERIFRTFSACL